MHHKPAAIAHWDGEHVVAGDGSRLDRDAVNIVLVNRGALALCVHPVCQRVTGGRQCVHGHVKGPQIAQVIGAQRGLVLALHRKERLTVTMRVLTGQTPVFSELDPKSGTWVHSG